MTAKKTSKRKPKKLKPWQLAGPNDVMWFDRNGRMLLQSKPLPRPDEAFFLHMLCAVGPIYRVEFNAPATRRESDYRDYIFLHQKELVEARLLSATASNVSYAYLGPYASWCRHLQYEGRKHKAQQKEQENRS